MSNNTHMKREVIDRLKDQLAGLNDTITILDSLDRDRSDNSAFDLHDQIDTLTHHTKSLTTCIKRCEGVNGTS